MNNDDILIPRGNLGTDEKPFVLAYTCANTYEYEITETTSRLFPSVEAHRAGCICGKWGCVEVAVHFVRYIESDELAQSRIALKNVVKRIHALKEFLPSSLVNIPGSKVFDLVDYWLEKHEQMPNGHALFWALSALWKLGDVNSGPQEFWTEMLAAGNELRNSWSDETKNAIA